MRVNSEAIQDIAVWHETMNSLNYRTLLLLRTKTPLVPLLTLIFVSACIHFIYYSLPLTVVLDEVYYGRFTMSYLKHEFFFDIHPPLAKLLLYGVAVLANLNPSFGFQENMQAFPDDSYLILRLLPRLIGTLLPLVFYGIARELGMSRVTAFWIAAIILLDNAFLVLSRFVLVDLFVLGFGFSGLWCYLRYRRTGSWLSLSAAALLTGAALSSKWTGLSFVGIIGLLELVRICASRDLRQSVRLLPIIVIPVLLYYLTFAAHFAITYRSGQDDWVMSPGFQATLSGNPAAEAVQASTMGFFAKFNELNSLMLKTASTMSGEHSYNSEWFTWPLMLRGVDFWANYTDTEKSHIYLLGNPLVWWVSTYAIALLLINFPPNLLQAWAQRQPLNYAESFIILGWIANMLPFILVSRGVFLYHYMAALSFAILGLGLVIERLPGSRWIMLGLAILATIGFVYFAPLSYGLLLPATEFDQRFWLESWR
jgi:dolichyl-phosphate-mannose--protein O-mannosyl transferase